MSDYLMPHGLIDMSDKLSLFERSPDVEVFGIVKAPIHLVWKLFRPFGSENLEWWKIYETMEIST
jgi:hypothetical protein